MMESEPKTEILDTRFKSWLELARGELLAKFKRVLYLYTYKMTNKESFLSALYAQNALDEQPRDSGRLPIEVFIQSAIGTSLDKGCFLEVFLALGWSENGEVLTEILKLTRRIAEENVIEDMKSINLAPRKVEKTFKSLFARGHSEFPKPREREINWIGETKIVTSVEVCGDKIIIGWTNGQIKIYSAVDLQCLTVLQFGGHPTCFQCTCTELISGHSDGNICVWNIQSGLLMHKFLMDNSTDCFPVCMRWRSPKLLVAGFDGTVKMWQYANSSFMSLSVSEHRPSFCGDNVRRIEFDTDYMICLHGLSVKVYYLNGLLVREINLFGKPTDFALQNGHLIVGFETEKNTLSIINIKTGIYLKAVEGPTASATAVDAKNNFGVSCDKKGQITLWDLAAEIEGNTAGGFNVRIPASLKSAPPRSVHLGRNFIVRREESSQRIVVTDFPH